MGNLTEQLTSRLSIFMPPERPFILSFNFIKHGPSLMAARKQFLMAEMNITMTPLHCDDFHLTTFITPWVAIAPRDILPLEMATQDVMMKLLETSHKRQSVLTMPCYGHTPLKKAFARQPTGSTSVATMLFLRP